jgi:AraC-like DNA-binding protein
MYDCFARESPPRVGELAGQLGISRVTLNQLFRRVAGVSTSDYIKYLQVQRAKRLLVRTRLSTTAIGYIAAFGTRRTFHRAFRRHTGMTPAQYRRAFHNVPIARM